MDVQTANGGTAPVAGGPSAGANGFAGQPETSAGRVTGSVNNVDTAAGQPDRAGQPKGNPETSPGVQSPQSVGLAKVFAGQPEAGSERVTGSANNINTAAGQPDQAGERKGNPETTQSNDNLSLPVWAQQLSKKLSDKIAADPNSAAALAAFKNLDDLVQAYLDAPAKGQDPAIPGEGSSPQETQAFYERLGKPKEAAGYAFAKDNPDFAQAAFDANLSAGQADALLKASTAQLDDARNGMRAALARDFQATDAALQKEYGERYNEAIVLMQRGLGNDPKTGAMSPVAQSLVDAGLAGKPEIVRAFIELGRATAEGTAPGGSWQGGQPQSILDGRGFSY